MLVLGKRPNKDLKSEQGHQIIWDDDLAENCTYACTYDCRGFWMYIGLG